MRKYNQADLDYLVRCEKKIIKPPKKTMTEINNHYQNNMTLASTDGEHRFYAFMRKLISFQEDFSIGLQYIPKDGERFILMRCQGPHGEYRGEGYIGNPHFDYHIHWSKSSNIVTGRKPEWCGEYTKEYATFEGALIYFIKTCNIIDADKYFTFLHQINLEDFWSV